MLASPKGSLTHSATTLTLMHTFLQKGFYEQHSLGKSFSSAVFPPDLSCHLHTRQAASHSDPVITAHFPKVSKRATSPCHSVSLTLDSKTQPLVPSVPTFLFSTRLEVLNLFKKNDGTKPQFLGLAAELQERRETWVFSPQKAEAEIVYGGFLPTIPFPSDPSPLGGG